MNSVAQLADALAQSTHTSISCTVNNDVLEQLDVLTEKLKERTPKANRSKVINSILEEKLTALKML